jgi:hypothetical protein
VGVPGYLRTSSHCGVSILDGGGEGTVVKAVFKGDKRELIKGDESALVFETADEQQSNHTIDEEQRFMLGFIRCL